MIKYYVRKSPEGFQVYRLKKQVETVMLTTSSFQAAWTKMKELECAYERNRRGQSK